MNELNDTLKLLYDRGVTTFPKPKTASLLAWETRPAALGMSRQGIVVIINDPPEVHVVQTPGEAADLLFPVLLMRHG